jgi:hypothetical protein
MNWIITNIKWIMLVSGILTCTMIYAALFPQAALQSTFGTTFSPTLEGPLAEIIVRNWGALITLVGGMLIYGAFTPASRPLVLTVAGISKVIFITLVLGFGRSYLGHQAGLDIALDTVMVGMYAVYLWGIRSTQPHLA